MWNRLEEEQGYYKTVAHIAPDRTVTFYEEDMTHAVRDEIQRIANSSEITIPATQDAPVFTLGTAQKGRISRRKLPPAKPPKSRLRLLPGCWRTGGKAPVGWKLGRADYQNAGTLCRSARKTGTATHREDRSLRPAYGVALRSGGVTIYGTSYCTALPWEAAMATWRRWPRFRWATGRRDLLELVWGFNS